MGILKKLLATCFGIGGDSRDYDGSGYSVSDYNDFHIMCTVSGGGIAPQRLSSFEASLNRSYKKKALEGFSYREATDIYDDFINGLEREFSGGVEGLPGTLKIWLCLKTKFGKNVKTADVNITGTAR